MDTPPLVLRSEDPTKTEGFVRRGLRDGSRAVQSGVFWLAEVVLGPLAGFATASLWPNPAPFDASAGLAGVVGGIATVLLIALLVLGWNFARAPFKQRDEARALVGSWQSETSRNDRLRSSLIHLQNSALAMVDAGDGELGLEEALAWRSAVIAAWRAERPEKVAEVEILLSGYPATGEIYQRNLLAQLVRKHAKQARAIGLALAVKLDYGTTPTKSDT